MLHFDLIIQQDQHLVDNIKHESCTNQLDDEESSTGDAQSNSNAAQLADHDAQADGTMPSGRSQADGTKAGVGSNDKDQGVSFKGDTCSKAVNAESVLPLWLCKSKMHNFVPLDVQTLAVGHRLSLEAASGDMPGKRAPREPTLL